jgi:hypothetical protein
VRGQDSDEDDEDAEGAIHAGLLHRGAHELRGRERVDHLPVVQGARGAHAAGPVGHAQRVQRLGPGLEEAAPEARSPRVGLRRERVDRDREEIEEYVETRKLKDM